MNPIRYDTIVVGAGIAGCCTAFALKQRGQSVLLVDRSRVPASGGSGAAGAFVSPKIGKGSILQTLTNEAFEFAKEFYLRYFPEHFYQTSIIRIPKDRDDSAKFKDYETFNSSDYDVMNSKELLANGINELENSFCFPDAGVCDAPAMCRDITKEIDFLQFDVNGIEKIDELWRLYSHDGKSPSLYVKNIILATGYQNTMVDMRYMAVRGTWGSRGDYTSDINLTKSMHKNISISANIKGIVKIAATHNKAKNPCMSCDGQPLSGLMKTASTMVDTSDFKLKETFCGMRAGSKDYFPLAGKVIDVPYMLETYPNIKKGAKPPIKHISNLYICNGLGGRGFVFAPMIADILAGHIVNDHIIDERINSDRLFLKWCRKMNKREL